MEKDRKEGRKEGRNKKKKYGGKGDDQSLRRGSVWIVVNGAGGVGQDEGKNRS